MPASAASNAALRLRPVISGRIASPQRYVGAPRLDAFWRNAALVKTAIAGMAETTPVATRLCYDFVFNRRPAMNQHAKVATSIPTGISPEEWQARTDLAAVYRLCARYGWGDVIYNHCSMRVPGEPSKFLMKQHELLWTEITASNLRKVDMNDDLDEKAGVNRPGFTLHGGVLKARPDVNCAVHIHTETGMAIAGLKHGLRMVSQQAIRFYNRMGYHAYEGITEDFEERARINRDLGQNRAMIMHNHGLLTVGKSAREAFVLMKTLVEAADIQLRMEATGGELIEIPSQICESTAAQYQTHDAGRGSADWPAFLRIADNIDPSYRN
jgi:ribulose-5-phosphate 4-epimerase/fuculose-1-phosphate aldolase